MPKPLLEQAKLVESVNKKTGKILVDIVTPGIGSAGYYSPEVCEAAAGLVQAGTQMFIDHPTPTEEVERPVRSVKDIAAVFTESARWDPDRGDAGSLVAEAQVVPAWVETMEVIQAAIGVSLRGSATDIVEGERPDGTRGRIVEGLHAIDSVDFVTHAGRGGAFALLESAAPSRVHARAVAHGVAEATVNDTREALQTALRDAYATADSVYLYVRDFEESDDGNTVWFEIDGSGAGDNAGTWGQAYTQADNGAVALTGSRAEVRIQTTYVPVTRPDSTTTTTESEEDTMPKIQIEESEHRSLVETAGRVPTLESELTTEKARGDNAEAQLAERDRRDAAMDLIREHDHGFKPLEVKGLVADLPLTEAGDFDADAFKVQLDEHAAAAKVAGGAGQITGMGGVTDAPQSATESSTPAKTPWGRELKGA